MTNPRRRLRQGQQRLEGKGWASPDYFVNWGKIDLPLGGNQAVFDHCSLGAGAAGGLAELRRIVDPIAFANVKSDASVRM